MLIPLEKAIETEQLTILVPIEPMDKPKTN